MADAPKIHIDSDWKAQAQAEKEKLAQETKSQPPAEGEHGDAGQIPPADFQSIVSGMVTQALLYMGGIPDPMSGQRMVHLDLAKHHIDLIGVLEAKTKGNLDAEESKLLSQTLQELRFSFVQLSKQVAEHLKKQADAGLKPGATTPGAARGGIIQ